MAEARVERRLAAILAADVAGYSRLIGNDEEGTLAALKACHREVIDPKVAEHRGRIVNAPAMPCSLNLRARSMQPDAPSKYRRRWPSVTQQFPKSAGLQFRIGINVGDVIVDGNEIYGDGGQYRRPHRGAGASGCDLPFR